MLQLKLGGVAMKLCSSLVRCCFLAVHASAVGIGRFCRCLLRLVLPVERMFLAAASPSCACVFTSTLLTVAFVVHTGLTSQRPTAQPPAAGN